jgi:PBP1b-binding outer membrane lipoprotein LpoB
MHKLTVGLILLAILLSGCAHRINPWNDSVPASMDDFSAYPEGK